MLQLPELIEHVTTCYIKVGLSGPLNVQALWKLHLNLSGTHRRAQ